MNPAATRAHVKANEGFRAQVYDDKTGKSLKTGDTLQGSAAIGFGRDLIHNGVADAEAEILLARDLERIYRAFDRDMPWWSRLPDDAQMVMADVSYQSGVAGLEGFHNMLAALQRGDFPAAAAELADSDLGRDYPERTARNAALLKACAGATS
jgi:lysozyme